MELLKQIDETITFNEQNIRVIGTCQEPWFVAKDICNILELPNITNALKILPEKWRGLKLLNTFGGEQNMIIINESGLYKLIMRSNKPIAQKFQEVVCDDILPTLRKKGEYKIQSIIDKNKELEEEKLRLENEKIKVEQEKIKVDKEKLRIENENKKLEAEQHISQNLIKQLNKKLEKKQRTKYELTNCVYIISNNLFKGYYKIGKSSSFNNRLNSYTSGAPVEYNVDYICKVRNKSEETAIENMVLQILSVYRVKNHMDQDREWLHGVELNIIKNEVNNCLKFINENREKYKKISNINSTNNQEEQVEIELEAEEEDIEKTSDTNNINNEEVEEIKKIDDLEVINEEIKDDEFIIIEEDVNDEDNESVVNGEKKSNLNKKVNTKYNLDDLQLKEKNNPVDFDKFISDYCEKGDNFHVIQSDLKLAFRIWSRTPLEMIEKKFIVYMNENYKDTRIFIDDQRRHVFKGVKLKPLKYIKTQYSFDFEEFIEKDCVVDYLHKISYTDFFYFFTEWKRQTEPSFTLNKYDKMNIKEILETFFCRSRVVNSVQSKTKNLFGILGVGTKGNNYGLLEKKRQTKTVKEYDVETNKLLKEYESIVTCAKELKFTFSTFSNHVRNQTVINGKYYKL